MTREESNNIRSGDNVIHTEYGWKMKVLDAIVNSFEDSDRLVSASTIKQFSEDYELDN